LLQLSAFFPRPLLPFSSSRKSEASPHAVRGSRLITW
jgi:hypothetical protein